MPRRGTLAPISDRDRLGAFDYEVTRAGSTLVHCPPGTRHAFVGAGDGPCVLLWASSRQFQKDGPWGLLLRRRDRRALQRKLARGHAGRRARVRAVPAAGPRAIATAGFRPVCERWMELAGLEPATSWVRSRRSPN
jgi:hypothetical protein